MQEFQPYHPRQVFCCEECQRVQARLLTKNWKAANQTSDDVKRNNLRKYGLQLEEFKQMVADRNSKCDICESTVDLVVDHCHAGGEVRGLLCNNCNTGLGLFKDDPHRLKSAISYLKKAYGNGST